jgi:hypothetical protein
MVAKRLSRAEIDELYALIRAAQAQDRPDLLNEAERVAGGRLPQWARDEIDRQRALMEERGVPVGSAGLPGDELWEGPEGEIPDVGEAGGSGVYSLIEVYLPAEEGGEDEHLGYRMVFTPPGADIGENIAAILAAWADSEYAAGGVEGAAYRVHSYFFRAPANGSDR